VCPSAQQAVFTKIEAFDWESLNRRLLSRTQHTPVNVEVFCVLQPHLEPSCRRSSSSVAVSKRTETAESCNTSPCNGGSYGSTINSGVICFYSMLRFPKHYEVSSTFRFPKTPLSSLLLATNSLPRNYPMNCFKNVSCLESADLLSANHHVHQQKAAQR
jgi:hypothetical protein